MALTADRHTPRKGPIGLLRDHPVAAGAQPFLGGLACIDANGDAVPGATATTLTAVGRFNETVDNSGGAAGDKSVQIEEGVFAFNNSAAADEIDRSHIGDPCYVVDDETVALTDGTATRSLAGTVFDVDEHGVWVKVGV